MNTRYLQLAALMTLIFLCYLPGASGVFLLDDYGTLSALSQWGSVDSFVKFQEFVFGGYAGPTGRPVSLASFVINSRTWPADPYGFLVTNIILHLFNTFLVYMLLDAIMKMGKGRGQISRYLPLIVAAAWGLHPANVSTVLYIVQRMTLLSALFSLSACYLLVEGVCQFRRQANRLGVIYCVIAGVLSLLALFSKENAAILPLQMLLLLLFLRWSNFDVQEAKLNRVLVWFLYISSGIILCCLVNIAYPHFAAFLNNGTSIETRRNFSLIERLMTESRVVGDYIIAFIWPKSQASGVFYDGYIVSTSLFNPVSTFIWLVIHAVSLLLAFYVRKRNPVFALGIFWFYISHLVESSVVMLELKFEHRNYLPGLGIAIAAAGIITSTRLFDWVKKIISSISILILSILLVLRTQLWGDPVVASITWANESPRSVRALEHAIALLEGKVDPQVVNQLLNRAVGVSNNDPVIKMKYILSSCDRGEVGTIYKWDEIAKDLRNSPLNWQANTALENILNRVAKNKCPEISFKQYIELIESVVSNKFYRKSGLLAVFSELKARSALVFGDNDLVVQLYEIQLKKNLSLDMVMRESIWLASYGYIELAVKIIDKGIERERKLGLDTYLLEQAVDMRNKISLDLPQDFEE